MKGLCLDCGCGILIKGNKKFCKNCRKKRDKSRYKTQKYKTEKSNYQKGYYQREEVKESRKIYKKEYREKNKESIAEYNKQYQETNKQLLKEKRNHPKKLAKKKEYDLEHKEEIKKNKDKYSKSKKGKITRKKAGLKRRALENNTIHKLSKKELQIIQERDKVCVYCQKKSKLTIDHIIPLKNGGKDIFLNIVMACESCNKSKKDLDVFYWCNKKGYKVPSIVSANISKILVLDKKDKLKND